MKERYSYTKKDINIINLKECRNLTYYESPIFQKIIKNFLEFRHLKLNKKKLSKIISYIYV